MVNRELTRRERELYEMISGDEEIMTFRDMVDELKKDIDN